MLKVYLVGGAVRDRLLGRPVHEKDWVVIGSTVDEMLKLRFKLVGKDFPVFLHPKTGEEYALARAERKIAKGYHGFEFYIDKNVTLEEDLIRRDLTVNAMAEDEDGTIIDPFGGQKDLKKKILRHVSDAFVEDPVRILRVARFASKLVGFTVAPETNDLMKKMVLSGEVDALVPERTWQEMQRALAEKHPHRFIEVLQDGGALKIIFPEIDALFGVPGPKEWHPEIDTGIHTLMALKEAVKLTPDPTIRFAVLMHDVGKAKTPKELLPKHHGHEELSAEIIDAFCQRLRVPNDYRELAVLVGRYHSGCHRIFQYGAKGILNFLEHLDAFRRPERFEKFLIACHADEIGREGFQKNKYPQADFLRKTQKICAEINTKDITENYQGEIIKQKIHERRLSAIENQVARTS